jgi:hypothetical protein
MHAIRRGSLSMSDARGMMTTRLRARHSLLHDLLVRPFNRTQKNAGQLVAHRGCCSLHRSVDAARGGPSTGVDGGQMGGSRPWGKWSCAGTAAGRKMNRALEKKFGRRWELLPRERVGAAGVVPLLAELLLACRGTGSSTMAPMAAAATKTSHPNWRSRAPRAGVRPWATASSLPWGKLQRAEEGAGENGEGVGLPLAMEGSTTPCCCWNSWAPGTGSRAAREKNPSLPGLAAMAAGGQGERRGTGVLQGASAPARTKQRRSYA